MSNIRIETLTPVHIGSGETLLCGNDFVCGRFAEDNDPAIGIIDPRRVMELIGRERIGHWVAAIERKEPVDRIVKVYAPHATLEDYCHRLVCNTLQKSPETLKEQIHDGNGRPYIPGSSLKGAIRTAVLSARMADGEDRQKWQSRIRNKYGKVQATEVEKALFGQDPTADVFRFLQVGDAYFGDCYEVAIRMINLNERERRPFRDDSKPQAIEAIGSEDEATFQIKFDTQLYELARNRTAALPTCMRSLPELFQAINQHTARLLEEEIRHWHQRADKDSGHAVERYIGQLEQMQDQTFRCSGTDSCVLRVGHGSGWRFITGAWTEVLDNFSSVVVPASRPRNERYESYDFPKTRRIGERNELLGFVKLTPQ